MDTSIDTSIDVGTRLVHNGRGPGQVIALLDGNRMVVEFDEQGTHGVFDRGSENFISEITGQPLAVVPPPIQKVKSARDRWRESGIYWPYVGHEDFFRTHNFTKSLAENPRECWWLAGYLQACGREVYHEPVAPGNPDVQRRGPTRHNYFPDPCKLGLDQKVGEFFDYYRKGFVQVNSVELYNFLDTDPTAPAEYHDDYAAGKAAGLNADKRKEE